jgi:YD repeat-containing protein
MQTFEYDALGNITNKSDVGDYAYPDASGCENPDAVTEIAGTALSYDNNGNVTSIGPKSFVWDYLNRLVQAGDGTTTSTYAYDPWGERVKATVATATSTTTTYYPTKYYNTDNVPTKHIFANGEAVATVNDTGANATAQYIHTDHLGGTNVVTDSSGNIAELADYYPYGSSRLDEQTEGAAEQRKFIGEMYDPATA